MISKRFKVLEIVDGKEYVFSPFAFKSNMSQFKAKRKEQGKASEDAFAEIAEAAYVSVDALKNWMYGKNGPADLETVKRVSAKLEVNYMDLLKEQEKEKMEEKKMANSNYVDMNRAKDAIRLVYQKMAAFMDAAVEEERFDYSHETLFTYDAVYKDMLRTLHQCMLDIPVEVYDELEQVIEGTLSVYLYGYPEYSIDIWDCSDYTDFCKEHNLNEESGYSAFMENEAKEFYAKMREILKDYLA